MKEKLEEIRSKGLKKIEEVKKLEDLQEVTREITGKKSELTEALKSLSELSVEMKKTIGMQATEIKKLFADKLKEKEDELINAKSVVDKPLDLTLPGIDVEGGALHPITQMCYDLNDAFLSLGFEVYSEDDISSEKYAFDNLNFPADHPARQSMDTFYTEIAKNVVLRSQTSNAQIHAMEGKNPPIRIISPGRVYRNETTDARHERAFFQYEALIVDKDISFSSGMVMIQTILEKVFGRKINVRMREGFFPFTEPGYEIDMECLVCGGKGCKVCNHNGWIEVMPGGVIHPNVLKSANLDPEEWTGFYINIGLDRLVMMRYGVDDVRLFHSGDLRFLEQFK